ncbi:MAG: glycosyltransferase [Sterolibacterium sp.]|nr:glycosyltransferase [Sterolibacterium sp.]
MNQTMTGRIVVVTPVFEDRYAASRLFAELHAILGDSLWIVAVEDGSVQAALDSRCLGLASGVILHLRRNMGHQRAIAVGLSHVATCMSDITAVVVMDSDGEDLPSSVLGLLQNLAREAVDVVVAQRGRRAESLQFRMFYAIYKRLFGLLTGRKLTFGNFMALSPQALQRLVAMPELWTHVASCVLASRLRIASCPLDRGVRYTGHSKMNFVGLALHGFRAAMVFAEDVLVRVGVACASIASMAILAMTAAIFLKLAGFATPGWFSVALGLLILMVLQTGTLTLLTLMLTGTVRGTAATPPAHNVFIARQEYSNGPFHET